MEKVSERNEVGITPLPPDYTTSSGVTSQTYATAPTCYLPERKGKRRPVGEGVVNPTFHINGLRTLH